MLTIGTLEKRFVIDSTQAGHDCVKAWYDAMEYMDGGEWADRLTIAAVLSLDDFKQTGVKKDPAWFLADTTRRGTLAEHLGP